MRDLIVEPEAEDELAAATEWYERREPGLGAALISALDDAIEELRRGESVGVSVPGVRPDLPVRRVLLSRFPYAVVFLDHADVVHVIAFAHHKRRPNYWRKRL